MRANIAGALLATLIVVACGSSEQSRRVHRDAGDDSGGSMSTGGRSGSGGSKATGGTLASGGAPSTGGDIASGGTEPVDASSGGASIDASVDGGGSGGDASVGDSATPMDAAVVLPPGIIAAVPYTCDSPFAHVAFPEYFYLENWEDHVLDQPGVSLSTNILSSSFGGGLVDSIDCDDGATDGKCANCDAVYGDGTITITFDEAVLQDLPTHVGFVWTDGGANSDVTITGYDAADAVIYTQKVAGIGDNSISGTVDEDRFFGIVSETGVKRVVIVNSTGGVEIDHLQYGR